MSKRRRTVKFMKKRNSVILFIASALVLVGAIAVLIVLQK